MPGKTNIKGEYSNISAVRTRKSNWKIILKGLSKADGVWITVFNSDIILTFLDYPHPIPVMAGWEYSTDGSTWTTVSADGEINTDGTFTGSVKIASALTLNDYSNGGEQGLRMDGTPLSVARYGLTSFVNGGKGYVCGGNVGVLSFSADVDIYDTSGNRTTGTPLSGTKGDTTSFVIGNRGYVCGNGATVDVYDLSGNRTTGAELSAARTYMTSFVNGDKGYVCGGSSTGWLSVYFDTVDVYDLSGNRTTGTSLSDKRMSLTSFVNGNKGYVCGGQRGSDARLSTVDVYDLSGNRTTGTALSVARMDSTSFVNGGKGYVCGGRGNDWTAVDIYDLSGNRTTGTSLSVGRAEATSFVNGNKGYVCGGNDTSLTVDVYDSSGNRTIGTDISDARVGLTSFVNGDKGYVCGGGYTVSGDSFMTSLDTVDIYYDEHIANIPITEGSTYTLNGTSGTATESGVLTFGEKVSGTINYKSGGIQV